MVFDHQALQIIQRALKAGQKSVVVSSDAGLTESEIDLGQLGVTLEQMEPILKKDRNLFKYEDGRFEKLAMFEDGFYQLVSTGEAPTIEIDGIQMHRTKEIKPFEDSRQKASTVIHKGDIVLDCCGGLGYTALWAIRLGAAQVYTSEPNPCVRALREHNPWSQELFDKRIFRQDVTAQDFIQVCEDNFFTCVIHDPPRFSLAGELYSQDFYDSLVRVLKPKGRLFHYTGNPYSKGRGRNFIEGIIKRLSQAGFKVTRRDDVLGVTGVLR